MLLSVSVLICDDINLEPYSLVKIHSLKYLKYIFFGFLVLVFIWKKPDDVYRERPRNELKVPFSSHHLTGKSSPLPEARLVESEEAYPSGESRGGRGSGGLGGVLGRLVPVPGQQFVQA